MNQLALFALEMLEPDARKLLRDCETYGELFERKWRYAKKQAQAVVAAMDEYRAAQHRMRADLATDENHARQKLFPAELP